MTIIASSIPALRVLFREMHTTIRQFYGQSKRNATYGSGTAKRFESHSRSAEVKSQSGGMKDDDSDREILGTQSRGRIMRAVEIEVEYGSVDDIEAYKMEPQSPRKSGA